MRPCDKVAYVVLPFELHILHASKKDDLSKTDFKFSASDVPAPE